MVSLKRQRSQAQIEAKAKNAPSTLGRFAQRNGISIGTLGRSSPAEGQSLTSKVMIMLGKTSDQHRGHYEPDLTMPDSIDSSSALGFNKSSS